MQFVLLQLPQQSKKLVYTYAWLVCNLLKLYCTLCLQSVGFAYLLVHSVAGKPRQGWPRKAAYWPGLGSLQTVEGKPNQGPSLYATYVRQHYERKFIFIVQNFHEAFLLSKSEQISKYIKPITQIISYKELPIFVQKFKILFLLLFQSGQIQLKQIKILIPILAFIHCNQELLFIGIFESHFQ